MTGLALGLLVASESKDLAEHLAQDLVILIGLSGGGSRLAVKRKAIVAAFRVLSVCSESVVPVLFPKLVDRLSDPETAAAAVNVFCEMATSDPKAYLPLAPDFFRILTESKNNWVLIKIVKIFGKLGMVEKRLGKKVLEPIVDLMKKSNAKSLVFECIRVVLTSFSDDEKAVRAAIGKIKEDFLNVDDANLRYLGLNALSMLKAKDSWAIEENREVVIKSLSDHDPNIRREALHLIMSMVFETNVVEISVLLISYAIRSDPLFANEIIDAILVTCGRNYYEVVQDFDWYVMLLGDMARNPHCEKGEEIGRQLVDIGLRVRDARQQLVRVVRDLLIDPQLLGNHFFDSILSASAFISGEYVEFSKNPLELLESLLQPRTNLLPSLVRAVYVQSVLKVLVICLSSYIKQSKLDNKLETSECTSEESEDDDSTSHRLDSKQILTHEIITHMIILVESAFAPLFDCDEVEVLERARNVLGLIHLIRKIPNWEAEEMFRKDKKILEIIEHFKGIFSEELGPVSMHAQQKVTIPEDLILKENLSDLATIFGDDDIVPTSSSSLSFSLKRNTNREIEDASEQLVESTTLLAEHRKRHGLYYLPNDEPGSNDYPKANELSVDNDSTMDDLLKLTKKSQNSKKGNSKKARPVVVKLDEGDDTSTSLKKAEESKVDKMSSAIRDVLLENKGGTLEHSSNKTKGATHKELIPIENVGEMAPEGSSSSKQHRHSKQKHRSNLEKVDDEEKTFKKSSKSTHGKKNHKHRPRDVSLDVVPQAPVIQDFLL